MAARLIQRISMRWLPDPPYEHTDTVVMNVGGYHMNMRVMKGNGLLEWGFAGERTILSETPCELPPP